MRRLFGAAPAFTLWLLPLLLAALPWLPAPPSAPPPSPLLLIMMPPAHASSVT
ncbi:MAG TPA: hypothetical protein VNE18_02135 [Rhodanobacter sp.]|nr:hypothetical protein [Rhodanobacter sp.]